MATIPWLADVLRAAGVQVVEEGNWLGRAVSGSFNPIGVLWHHTASSTTSPSNPHPALNIVINGRSDLQGPLAQALVDYNGVFHIVSAGRCNHAGAARVSGPIPAGDGNTMLIGWEIDYNGVSQTMSAAQYQASLKATAAVLRQLGKDASYARGHRETSTTGKIDPYGVNLDTMRAEVAAILGGSPPPTYNFSTYGAGVNVRADARLNAPIVATLPGPTQVFVQCQKQGDIVNAEGHTNNWWSRLRDQGGYISNIYIDHPAAQLPGIPNC
jgi:hypothetical protein